MQHADQIDDGIGLRNQAIQRGIVMDIGFDHLHSWQHEQVTGARQMARWHDNTTARGSESRHHVGADKTTAPND
jgi:hypothetical protein